MSFLFICDQTFKSESYTVNNLPKGEYDNCTFINCDFSDSYISNITFLECSFIDCNFSMIKAKGVILNTVVFTNCKLLGVPFYDCNPFLLSVTFNNCQLNLSSFFNLKLKGTTFKACKLNQTDFTNTDLTNSKFIDCDLFQVIFDNTKLENVDFSTSCNLSFDPNNNRIRNAIFSKENALGLLRKFQINIE